MSSTVAVITKFSIVIRIGDAPADSRAVPGPPVALVAGAGWNVRYPVEALVAICRCAHGACALASSRADAGLPPAPLGAADAAFSGHLLLGILDPADELVSGQRRDVLPTIECRRAGAQRLAQVCGKLVHYPTGHSLSAHRATVASRGQPVTPTQRHRSMPTLARKRIS